MYAPLYHPKWAAEAAAAAQQALAAEDTQPALASAAPPGSRREGRRWIRRVTRFAGAAGWLVVILGAGLLLVPSLLGYDRYVIVSGSMHPLLDRGWDPLESTCRHASLSIL